MWRVVLKTQQRGRTPKLIVKGTFETRPEARKECWRLFELSERFGSWANYEVVSETGWKRLQREYAAKYPKKVTKPSTPQQREKWRADHLRRTGVSEAGIRRIKEMGYL